MTPAERARLAYEALLEEVELRDRRPGLWGGTQPISEAPAATPHEQIVQARIAEDVDPSEVPESPPEASADVPDANTGTVAEAPAPTEPALDPLTVAWRDAWLRRLGFGR